MEKIIRHLKTFVDKDAIKITNKDVIQQLASLDHGGRKDLREKLLNEALSFQQSQNSIQW